MRFPVGDAPVAGQTNLPPASTPVPAESLNFMVTAFDDGSAVASWTRLDGSAQKAYLADFDLVYNGEVMMEVLSGTIVPPSPELPYGLTVWSFDSTKPTGIANLTVDPAEADTLAKLTDQAAWVRNEMIAKVDWRANNPMPPPEPEDPFDDQGNPLHEFFRVREYTVDSNYDGTNDHLQIASGNAFNMDIDSDGIPNGYDSDIFTNAVLTNVFINEVLYANEFTNTDQFDKTEDWIELYNPTTNAIGIGGWFLSDRASDLGKWEIPANTVIGSGEFLVIWASGTSRTNAGEALHTKFAIKRNGVGTADVCEAVYLSRPNSGEDPSRVDYYVPGYKHTANLTSVPWDISYGRYPSSSGPQCGYFILPTPGDALTNGIFTGAHNVQGALGICDPPVFSGAAPGLYSATNIVAELVAPASGGTVHFTRNCTNPTRYSELYDDPMEFDRTAVITAITAKEGYLQSHPISRSFLFTEDIVGTAPEGVEPDDYQGARETNGQFKGLLYGYPEASPQPSYPLEYGMHPGIIASNKAAILDALANYPIVSLTMPVPGLFDVNSGGLYANSELTESQPDPLDRKWRRFGTFSFLPNGTGGEPVERNAGVSMTGASSLQKYTTRKHNWRIRFGGVFGEGDLTYPLFPDNTNLQNFASVHLKNPTQDSWSQNSSTYYADNATYCDEAWVRAAHIAMGHAGSRRRWVNLFVNGIYWGSEELTERIDAEFMKEHFGGDDYDVLKQGTIGPLAVDGNLDKWNELIVRCQAVSNAVATNASATVQQDLFAEVEEYLDLDNYIDYLICNTYALNSDWPGNNYRMARKEGSNSKFIFFVWDAEYCWNWKDDILDYESASDQSGVAAPHLWLKHYAGYREHFSQRAKKHFFVVQGDSESGCLAVVDGSDRAAELYQVELNRFEPLVWCESARWGSLLEDSPNPPGRPYVMSDWANAANFVLTGWLPYMRTYYFELLADDDLFVAITNQLPAGSVGETYNETLMAFGGTVPYAFTNANGSLPPGLDLSGAIISGIPTAEGTNNFHIGVSSSDGISGMRQFTLIVEP